MLVRVLQFLVGALLAGGGGYLAWLNRADAANVFPPGPAGLPLMLLVGVAGVTTGVVLLVSGVHPRSRQRRARAARAAREDAALGEAEAYYSDRTRAADRDWRSGDIAPLAPPAPPSDPPPEPPQPAETLAATSNTEISPPAKPRSLSVPPEPQKPIAPAPRPAAKPAASTEAAPNGVAPPPPSPFPAQVTLAPLPRAAEPPPVPAQSAPATALAGSTPPPIANDPHAAIRSAIAGGKLEEADRLLAAARENATGLDLALLTALAGDHAAVSGQQSHAKWLWRLALKRFGELGAMESGPAKAVAESLRKAG